MVLHARGHPIFWASASRTTGHIRSRPPHSRPRGPPPRRWPPPARRPPRPDPAGTREWVTHLQAGLDAQGARDVGRQRELPAPSTSATVRPSALASVSFDSSRTPSIPVSTRHQARRSMATFTVTAPDGKVERPDVQRSAGQVDAGGGGRLDGSAAHARASRPCPVSRVMGVTRADSTRPGLVPSLRNDSANPAGTGGSRDADRPTGPVACRAAAIFAKLRARPFRGDSGRVSREAEGGVFDDDEAPPRFRWSNALVAVVVVMRVGRMAQPPPGREPIPGGPRWRRSEARRVAPGRRASPPVLAAVAPPAPGAGRVDANGMAEGPPAGRLSRPSAFDRGGRRSHHCPAALRPPPRGLQPARGDAAQARPRVKRGNGVTPRPSPT